MAVKVTVSTPTIEGFLLERRATAVGPGTITIEGLATSSFGLGEGSGEDATLAALTLREAIVEDPCVDRRQQAETTGGGSQVCEGASVGPTQKPTVLEKSAPQLTEVSRMKGGVAFRGLEFASKRTRPVVPIPRGNGFEMIGFVWMLCPTLQLEICVPEKDKNDVS